MPENLPAQPSDAATGAERRTTWDRLLDAVLPAPDADRLVRVAELSRAALPLAEGALADVDVTPVIQEVPGTNRDTRFAVLVSARDASLATEVLAVV